MNIDTALTWIAVAHTWHIAPLGVYFMLATLQVIPARISTASPGSISSAPLAGSGTSPFRT